MPGLYLISDKLKDLKLLSQVRTGGILRSIRQVENDAKLFRTYFRGLASIMSGTAVLKLPTTGISITAASLNAAAAGTAKASFALWVADNFGDACMTIDKMAPTLTPGEAVLDADVAAPTVTGTPKFDRGRCLVELTFDTDAGTGDTKTYVAAETMTVDCDLSILGSALAQVTFTVTLT